MEHKIIRSPMDSDLLDYLNKGWTIVYHYQEKNSYTNSVSNNVSLSGGMNMSGYINTQVPETSHTNVFILKLEGTARVLYGQKNSSDDNQ